MSKFLCEALHLTSFDSQMRALVAVKRVVDYAVKVSLACWFILGQFGG